MKATAFVVGPQDGPGAALRDMAHELGFMTVLPYQNLAAAEAQAQQTPLSFFLFAAVDNIRTLAPAAETIRFCTSRRIRFSPLIYFAESPSLETIRACVAMGFDDVITLPFAHERVRERLARQLDTMLVYFETAGYFGPDRRRLASDPTAASDREQTGHYRRLEIMRSIQNGATVLKDEAHAA